MKLFSIRELENFSGVKAHTLRMWEKRYQIFVPERTKGNIRFYSLDQVRQLLNLAVLIRSGYRISVLSKLPVQEIQEKVDALKNGEQRIARAINSLICLMFSTEIEAFEAVLDDCILSWQINKTVTEVIIPFLQRTDLLSYQDHSSEVHFVVTAVRNKIIMGIEKLEAPFNPKKTALLFLPENEHYDLILLYMYYLLKVNGTKVLYMGTNITAENLRLVLQVKKPDFLYTYIPQKSKYDLQQLINHLSGDLQEMKLFVAQSNSLATRKQPTNGVAFIHYNDVSHSHQD
jgi:DNA-binding transcriptional MerR regulator